MNIAAVCRRAKCGINDHQVAIGLLRRRNNRFLAGDCRAEVFPLRRVSSVKLTIAVNPRSYSHSTCEGHSSIDDPQGSLRAVHREVEPYLLLLFCGIAKEAL